MSNISKLTPEILKQIIKEEKLNILKQIRHYKKINENKPTLKKDIEYLKALIEEERKVAVKYQKIKKFKQILKERLMEKL
jgi:hypothetical protein|tara:strand:+ start:193 stop:432 length:240 start_codon:yes stop_codon:yes gene_type:complete